ncbi:MAG: PadR family transcriptional regulator [Devosia sp.]|nr:PadR family transcriptional regulator [Devosia sp.]
MRMHHHDHHEHDHHGPDHHGRGPFGRGRGPGGPGGRTSLGRFFAHGDLRLVILSLIAEKPRHGYEIIKAIEEAVAGAYSPSPGTIYPTLTLLEELGYVTVAPSADGSKKLHEITDAGRAFLAANQRALEGLLARMEEAKGMHGGGPAPQIVRAMENLKLALSLRLGRGPLSQEQIETIAAALDAAATAVERV